MPSLSRRRSSCSRDGAQRAVQDVGAAVQRRGPPANGRRRWTRAASCRCPTRPASPSQRLISSVSNRSPAAALTSAIFSAVAVSRGLSDDRTRPWASKPGMSPTMSASRAARLKHARTAAADRQRRPRPLDRDHAGRGAVHLVVLAAVSDASRRRAAASQAGPPPPADPPGAGPGRRSCPAGGSRPSSSPLPGPSRIARRRADPAWPLRGRGSGGGGSRWRRRRRRRAGWAVAAAAAVSAASGDSWWPRWSGITSTS